MTSKAAKRRAKRNRLISLPGAEPVQGRVVGKDRPNPRPTDDARRTVLAARCRQSGIRANHQNLERAASQLQGCELGKCIEALHQDPQVRADLWQIWQDMGKARRNWRMRNTGHTGDPQSAAIALIHDDMQTDPGLTVDHRTPEERDRQARRSHDYWMGLLSAVEAPNWKAALRGALDAFPKALWQSKPTSAGICAVRALESVYKTHKKH